MFNSKVPLLIYFIGFCVTFSYCVGAVEFLERPVNQHGNKETWIRVVAHWHTHTHPSSLWEQGLDATVTGSSGETDICILSTSEIWPGNIEMEEKLRGTLEETKQEGGRVKSILTCPVCETWGCWVWWHCWRTAPTGRHEETSPWKHRNTQLWGSWGSVPLYPHGFTSIQLYINTGACNITIYTHFIRYTCTIYYNSIQ